MMEVRNLTFEQLHEAIDSLKNSGLGWKDRSDWLSGELDHRERVDATRRTIIAGLERRLDAKQSVLDATIEINRCLEVDLRNAEKLARHWASQAWYLFGLFLMESIWVVAMLYRMAVK